MSVPQQNVTLNNCASSTTAVTVLHRKSLQAQRKGGPLDLLQIYLAKKVCCKKACYCVETRFAAFEFSLEILCVNSCYFGALYLHNLKTFKQSNN